MTKRRPRPRLHATGFLLLKPEATPFVDEMQDYLAKQRQKETLPARGVIDRMLSVLAVVASQSLHHLEVHRDVSYVETGLMDDRLFRTLYPHSAVPDEDVRRRMKRHYLANRYYIGFFQLPTAPGDLEPFTFLRRLKGLMSWEDPRRATGLRGHLLRHLLSMTPEYRSGSHTWRDTGNFLHLPDGARDAERVRRFVTSEARPSSREVLYDAGVRRLGFWDLYRIVDDQLFLDAIRTEREVQAIAGTLSRTVVTTVLDLGCGDGRLAAGLSSLGYRVLGIDLDGKAVGRAMRHASGAGGPGTASYVVWPMEKVRSAFRRRHDAAILMYAVFVLRKPSQLAARFRSVYASLRWGGLLIVDSLLAPRQDTPRIRMLSDSHDITTYGIAQLRRTRSWDAAAQQECTIFDIVMLSGDRAQYRFEQRIPSREELCRALSDAGFTIVSRLSAEATVLASLHRRCIVVAQKGHSEPPSGTAFAGGR